MSSPIVVSASRKIAVVTGGTGAIGGAIATAIAKAGYALILPVRDVAAGNKLADNIKHSTANSDVYVERVDLSSSSSIRAFAATVRARYSRLNVLVNNAAATPSNRRQVTADGYEYQFAINVIAYYGLMVELWPLLAESGTAEDPSRIVNVASNYAGDLDLSDLHFARRSYNANAAYRQSKQADRMLSWAAARLFNSSSVTVNACHPGIVTSKLLTGLGSFGGYDSPAAGARTPAFLATDPSVRNVSGEYFVSSKQQKCQFATDTAAVNALWQYVTAEWTKSASHATAEWTKPASHTEL